MFPSGNGFQQDTHGQTQLTVDPRFLAMKGVPGVPQQSFDNWPAEAQQQQHNATSSTHSQTPTTGNDVAFGYGGVDPHNDVAAPVYTQGDLYEHAVLTQSFSGAQDETPSQYVEGSVPEEQV